MVPDIHTNTRTLSGSYINPSTRDLALGSRASLLVSAFNLAGVIVSLRFIADDLLLTEQKYQLVE